MQKIYDLEGKNKAILLFKSFAALLITYSHMGMLFPHWNWLVTGGAIGDGLFFFCSGFTLFLGRDGGFGNWYKRRISRIFPSIIMWALFSSVVFGWIWMATDIITTPKYWFIPCIMVYYAIFYVIRRFLMQHMKMVFWSSLIVVAIISLLVLNMNQSVMYAQVSFMRVYYFMFMLLGAITALDLKSEPDKQIFGKLKLICVNKGRLDRISLTKSLILFLGSIIIYYVCMGVFKLGAFWCHFQMVSLLPLLTGIYFFFMLCSTDTLQRVFDHPLVGNVVYAISSLTLEIYLVQYAVFSDSLNNIFPLNIVVAYVAIFALAYVLKCLSNLFAQVFDSKDLDLPKIFKL